MVMVNFFVILFWSTLLFVVKVIVSLVYPLASVWGITSPFGMNDKLDKLLLMYKLKRLDETDLFFAGYSCKTKII